MPQRDLAGANGVGERFIVELEAGKPTAQLGKALAVAKSVGGQPHDNMPPFVALSYIVSLFGIFPSQN